MQPALFTFALAFLLPAAIRAQQRSLQKLWETDTIIAVPESVLPDPANNILYVSLVDGGPWDVDGKGGVGRLSPDGKKYNGSWITGLNAPKGMGRYGNRLYVADISEVVVIDISKGSIIKKIPIQGATGLNDITVDDKGVVYVSDSKAGKIYRIADPHKTLKVICDLPNGGDGVEEVGNGDLIVSEWVGNVFYVYADGRKVQMLDRKPEKKNTADIWYDQKTKTLYVPGFFGKTITAYRLK